MGHITRLVDDLLDASRITRGKVELKREPLEISQVIAKAIEMSSPLLEQRRHHLDVDVLVRGLAVEGDTLRLAQVVSNLLINAAKYTEPGGHVTVRARRAGERVLLEVSDDGIGIAPNMLERIFAPFAQERQALDRAQGGLGLGLTIVANLVKLHGGTVSAHSAGRGKGSTFTVDLPLARSSTTARGVTRGRVRSCVGRSRNGAARSENEDCPSPNHVRSIRAEGGVAAHFPSNVGGETSIGSW